MDPILVYIEKSMFDDINIHKYEFTSSPCCILRAGFDHKMGGGQEF